MIYIPFKRKAYSRISGWCQVYLLKKLSARALEWLLYEAERLPRKQYKRVVFF